MLRFWGQKVKGQGHGAIKYAGDKYFEAETYSTRRLVSTSGRGAPDPEFCYLARSGSMPDPDMSDLARSGSEPDPTHLDRIRIQTSTTAHNRRKIILFAAQLEKLE